MSEIGRAHRETDGTLISLTFYRGRFTGTVEPPGDDPSFSDYEYAIYEDGDRTMWGTGRYLAFHEEQIRGPTVGLHLTAPDGTTTTHDITSLIVDAYQQVNPDESPLIPDFEAMTTDELVEYVEGGDDHMSLSDLRAIQEYVRRGDISREQASSLLAEWLADRG